MAPHLVLDHDGVDAVAGCRLDRVDGVEAADGLQLDRPGPRPLGHHLGDLLLGEPGRGEL